MAVALGFCIVGLMLAGGMSLVQTQRRPRRVSLPGNSAPTGTLGPASAAPSAAPSAAFSNADWPIFAEVQGLMLVVPNPGVKAVAYHQASYPDALTLRPRGVLLRNYGGRLFHPIPETPGPRYIVQPQRTGRSTDLTSAVDLVAPEHMDIYSPITGKVVFAKRYKLYGQYPDMQVEIVPADHQELRVVLIHLTDLQVHKGDEVSATLSVIGSPRVFPFRSVVNDYVGGGDPHVHLEVKENA